jgi:D-isomer specific 2-hydroxyacid dehydrogenase, NAD binding domain
MAAQAGHRPGASACGCVCRQYGCLVVNAPTANTVAAAEHGIALLCALTRNVAQADRSVKDGKWDRNTYVGVSLVGKTIAIMGFGKVWVESCYLSVWWISIPCRRPPQSGLQPAPLLTARAAGQPSLAHLGRALMGLVVGLWLCGRWAAASLGFRCRIWLSTRLPRIHASHSTPALAQVGSEVARRAKGLGMTVIAHDPYASDEKARALGVRLVGFDEALATADFFSLHMPLTDGTKVCWPWTNGWTDRQSDASPATAPPVSRRHARSASCRRRSAGMHELGMEGRTDGAARKAARPTRAGETFLCAAPSITVALSTVGPPSIRSTPPEILGLHLLLWMPCSLTVSGAPRRRRISSTTRHSPR